MLLLIIIAMVAMILKVRRRGKEPGRGKEPESVLDTYEVGFYPDIKLSKLELEAATGSRESGVYCTPGDLSLRSFLNK